MASFFDITGYDAFLAFAENDEKEKRMEVEKTINIMEDAGKCLHPDHLHSFQQVNFLVSAFARCCACNERISSVVVSFGGGDASQQVVKCVACGALAHRSCAVSKHTIWHSKCAVNSKHVPSTAIAIAQEAAEDTGDDDDNTTDEEAVVSDSQGGDKIECSDLNETNQDAVSRDASSNETKAKEMPQQSQAKQIQAESNASKISTIDGDNDENDAPDAADTISSDTETDALHYANSPFPSVARALQENILASFKRGKNKDVYQQHENAIAKFANGTIEAVKGRGGVAAVAGGIAGGVAGLALAGPAGAFAGYQLAAVAGGLGVMVEGSVAVGVVVASIATGGITGKQIHDHIEERRVLTMGEEGASRKVLLVRPNIQIDPVWDQITDEARKSAPSRRRGPQRIDSDIVMTDEDEIPTTDKVLLLVSRTLNDKTSLAGHVYRYLLEAFHDRCLVRKKLCETNTSIAAVSPRARRDDAHAVIKHVTATLMEQRPEFGASPSLTEVTATAVEGLVFGQLYDSVFEEIVIETKDRDMALRKKIADLEDQYGGDIESSIQEGQISEAALDSLKVVPQGHSAGDKLYFCSRFLDLISEHFSNNKASHISADSLLKMACQHLVLAASTSNFNAEVSFLEEFARDEQLLCGREGYALVTLQASLHFLNMSTDLKTDIFREEDIFQEEEEEDEIEETESNFQVVEEVEPGDVEQSNT